MEKDIRTVIKVSSSILNEIMNSYNTVSKQTVYNALNAQTNSVLANEIRRLAKKLIKRDADRIVI